MPISLNDQKNKIQEYIFNTPIINIIFGNIIYVSIIIVILNIIILYINQNENFSITKLFIWMTISTNIILILHNKTIKLDYQENSKKQGSEEFKSMMDNNTLELIGKNESIEKDIIKFLD